MSEYEKEAEKYCRSCGHYFLCYEAWGGYFEGCDLSESVDVDNIVHCNRHTNKAMKPSEGARDVSDDFR